MNIQTMRAMDYWLGRPLCLLLSLLNLVLRIITRPKKIEGPPGRILLVKLSELGAIVLAYPLLKQLKQRYPSAELFFVTFEKNRDVFKILGGIIPTENILVISDRSILSFAIDTLRLIIRMRQKRFDITFDLEFFSRFSSILTYFSRSKKRVGFYHYTFEGLYRGDLLTHKVQYNPLSHISKNYLSLLQVVKADKKTSPELEGAIDIKDLSFPHYVRQEEINRSLGAKIKALASEEMGKIFLINPGEGALPLREWPLDNFIALSRMILEEDNHIIIIGTEGASGKSKLIGKILKHPRCLDLVGQTTLEEILELFSISDALISNDCGLTHLAMLTPIKKFIMFGPESPQVFGPLDNNNWIFYSAWPCSPCLSALNHRASSCRDNNCLKDITPERVYRSIKDAL